MNKVNKNIINILRRPYLSARKRGTTGVEAIDQNVHVAGNAMLMRGPKPLMYCCKQNGRMGLDQTSLRLRSLQPREACFETSLHSV